MQTNTNQTLNLIQKQIKAFHKPVRVIFPEGSDARIQKAAAQLADTNIICQLVFLEQSQADAYHAPSHVAKIVIAKQDLAGLALKLFELRKNKNTQEECEALVKKSNYFSVMQVATAQADVMVGGIQYATKDIIRPALQITKTKKEAKLVSSIFFMHKGSQQFIFTDCALNIDPDPQAVVEIAKLAYQASKLFLFKEPKLALLSYSTKGSGQGPSVAKMQQAKALLDEQKLGCSVMGEYQLDSALDPLIRKVKDSANQGLGAANILVFPNLDSGNIGYKLVKCLAGYEAVGPILMGLGKPVNDLSRGANTQEIINTVFITAYQYVLEQTKDL